MQAALGEIEKNKVGEIHATLSQIPTDEIRKDSFYY
jgi:hypothetical protein